MRRNLTGANPASFVSGILLGCLVFCMAFPWGFAPEQMFLAACVFILVTSVALYVVFCLAPDHGFLGDRLNIYDINHATLGLGLGIAVLGLFVAAFEKLQDTFSMAPFEAAFSATFGLGFYLGVCAFILWFLTRIRF